MRELFRSRGNPILWFAAYILLLSVSFSSAASETWGTVTIDSRTEKVELASYVTVLEDEQATLTFSDVIDADSHGQFQPLIVKSTTDRLSDSWRDRRDLIPGQVLEFTRLRDQQLHPKRPEKQRYYPSKKPFGTDQTA